MDVRMHPRSRRVPQFNSDLLERSLPERGIQYVHARDLGGLRVPLEGSPNDGWREEGFRGYADHMATAEFGAAIARLETLASERATSVMCAEASWEHCHRRLLSDALVARGRRVLHIGAGRAAIRARADGLRGRRRDGGQYPRRRPRSTSRRRIPFTPAGVWEGSR